MLTDQQRKARIEQHGEPKLSIEFDVFEDNQVSMWTHFNHSDDFNSVKNRLILIKDYLDSFLSDEKMCPFHKTKMQWQYRSKHEPSWKDCSEDHYETIQHLARFEFRQVEK